MEGVFRGKVELEEVAIQAIATQVVEQLTEKGGIKNDNNITMTVSDIAEEMQMSKSKVYALLKQYNVKFYLFGSSKRYQREDVDDFKKKCKVD